MKPLVLCILDGVGIKDDIKGNAVKQANKPNLDKIWNSYPHSLLNASGIEVGLPVTQMGNSEVGHTNIGTGRVIYQHLQLINNEIESKNINKNKELLDVIEHVKKNGSKLHIFGLVSDGGVHSHINHLFSLLELSHEHMIEKTYIHIITDGRDTEANGALKYIKLVEEKIEKLNIGKIASISGRYYAMDRDNRWDRVKDAYEVIVDGKGLKGSDVNEIINQSYKQGIYDEFIKPTVIDENGFIDDNDGIMVFNFRPDRLRELFGSITNKNLDCFDRTLRNNLKLVTMFPVSSDVVCTNAYSNEKTNNSFGEYISTKGLKQLRIAETEKYAHVTYFFDGGKDLELPNCDRILIPSSKVATYDLKPEMSAHEITDKLLEVIDNYDIIIVNYANGDMVGHTGNMNATIRAIEVIDECLGKLYNKIIQLNGTLLITADHGNSDYMIDENDKIVTSHSMSKVPFIVCDNKYVVKDGKLADIAATMLKMLNLSIPNEMTGELLVEEKSDI